MLTKADKQFLKRNFATKDDLVAMEKRQDRKYATKNDLVAMEKRQDRKYAAKDDLKDLRSQITDDIDGKLKIQKHEILEEMDTKLSKQKENIVTDVTDYVADTIVPMFDDRDKKIARIEKKCGLAPLAG